MTNVPSLYAITMEYGHTYVRQRAGKSNHFLPQIAPMNAKILLPGLASFAAKPYFAGGAVSQGEGVNLEPSGSLRKWVLVMNSSVRYFGSLTIVVTVNHSAP